MSRPPAIALEHLRAGQSRQFAEPPDLVGAETCFRSAASAAETWGEPVYWLAIVIAAQGRSDEAERSYRRAIALMLDDARPLVALGAHLKNSGRPRDAVGLLTQAVNMNPAYGMADAMLILADAHAACGDMKSAAMLWRQVIELPPAYPSGDGPVVEARRKLDEARSA